MSPITPSLIKVSSLFSSSSVDSCSSNYSIIENLNIILDKSPGTLQTEFNYNVTNVKCVWRIRAPRGYGIRLTFRYMNILPNVTCALRSVLLYSGYSMKEKYLMQRFCGENFAYSFPIIKYNPERNVIIELKAEQISSWDKQSFVASYEFIEKGEMWTMETGQCLVINIY